MLEHVKPICWTLLDLNWPSWDPLAISTGSTFRQETTGLTESAATISFSWIVWDMNWSEISPAGRVVSNMDCAKYKLIYIYVHIYVSIHIYNHLYTILYCWSMTAGHYFQTCTLHLASFGVTNFSTGYHLWHLRGVLVHKNHQWRSSRPQQRVARWHHDSIWGGQSTIHGGSPTVSVVVACPRPGSDIDWYIWYWWYTMINIGE